jgi:hypothetical protein
MAKLLITTDENEVIEVQGRMTFKISKVQTDDGDILIASGQLSMHNYIEGIVLLLPHIRTVDDIINKAYSTNEELLNNITYKTNDSVIKEARYETELQLKAQQNYQFL